MWLKLESYDKLLLQLGNLWICFSFKGFSHILIRTQLQFRIKLLGEV